MQNDKPIIVQSDKTVLLETANPAFEPARDSLSRFAELEKSPEYFHTYRITPLSLWNANASGMSVEEIVDVLHKYSKYDVPPNVISDIKEYSLRYGRIKLIKDESGTGTLFITSEDKILMLEIINSRGVQPFIERKIDDHSIEVRRGMRGHIKQALIKIGYPVEDLAGYVIGDSIELKLRDWTGGGNIFSIRAYQEEAIGAFYAGGKDTGGSGVIVLPCGAGKTIIGMGIIEKVKMHTLILTANTIALRQWRDELLDKTTIDESLIGEYSGHEKEIRPLTITTYQILTYRKRKSEDFPHFNLFNLRRWGLIIYDEVHLLPAPVFRIVAEIQGTRRLGLTATLIREDGREDDVFSLIGPKKYDVPWKVLEKQGWIAEAECTEIRVPMAEEKKLAYAVAPDREKYRVASTNPAKVDVLLKLIEMHKVDNILVIGQYLDQLEQIQQIINAPIITGKTPVRERERLYSEFKRGNSKLLIVSKVANFAIDLPDANVAIQVSGTFGSRQEEAQRLGRILRPKKDGTSAKFYTIVTRDTKDLDFGLNRQLFLIEQGYKYNVENY